MSNPSPIKKDVIYIDIEDDITSIIEKVKGASTQIVALVPPKRIGALQSVVNLKLLNRAAEHAKKRIVMITSDHALTALAAGVAIPVARNLQSKPEIADTPEVDDDDEEVIDGEAVATPDIDGSGSADEEITPVAALVGATAPRTDQRSRRRGPAIPDFDGFRNKIVLIGGGVLLVIVFIVWAIFFAPRATVTITAKTTPYSVNKPLVATADSKLDPVAGTLKATVEEIKKTVSADFTATGKKDVGEKAKGDISLSNSSLQSRTLVAGTSLATSGDLVFKLDAAVTVPGATFPCGNISCPVTGTATGAVTATESGTKYNTATGNLSGAPTNVSVSFDAPAAGGTDKTVTIVSEEDAAAAREKIKSTDADSVKADLKKQFASDAVVVSESFSVAPGSPTVSPAVGQEATTGKVTVETTYTMIGFARSDIRTILEKDLTKQIGGLPDQTIYDQGMDKISFNSYGKQDGTHKLNLIATGYVGPSINSTELAKQLVGKREGEIVQTVKTLEGIKSVDVKFSPFWVSVAPSADKITIKFLVENAQHN